MADASIHDHFTRDHRACDEQWSEVEAAIHAGDAATALARWKGFHAAMSRHFAWEEEILFPAFEDATGMKGVGPTAVMRMEHTQMRQILGQMDEAAGRGDLGALADLGDTLLMLIQQHNVKEEGMLYPMADRALAARREELLARVRAYGAAG